MAIFEELKTQFRDPEDPFEYIPVRLTGAEGSRRERTRSRRRGFYPHAGMLTVFQYLRRYPTTETNRNRLRARMYYQHFLGVESGTGGAGYGCRGCDGEVRGSHDAGGGMRGLSQERSIRWPGLFQDY